MGQNFVQPLQGTIQVQLDPARGAGDSLPPAEQIHTLSGEDFADTGFSLSYRQNLLFIVTIRVSFSVVIKIDKKRMN